VLSRRGSPRDPHRCLVSAPKDAGDNPGFSKIWQFGFLLVYPVFCPFRDRDGPQIPDLHVAMSSYCLVAVRRTLMGRSPFSNGTAARNSLGSSSARGSTGGEGRGSPRSRQANKRTAVQSASVWDHLSALLNPVDTWATKGKRRRDGPEEPSHREKLQGHRRSQPIVLHGSAEPGREVRPGSTHYSGPSSGCPARLDNVSCWFPKVPVNSNAEGDRPNLVYTGKA
jgi:hypothetical protein